MNFSALKFGKLWFNLEGGKSEDEGATYNHARAAAAPNTRNLWVFFFFFFFLRV
jgi:hypothetical protein